MKKYKENRGLTAPALRLSMSDMIVEAPSEEGATEYCCLASSPDDSADDSTHAPRYWHTVRHLPDFRVLANTIHRAA